MSGPEPGEPNRGPPAAMRIEPSGGERRLHPLSWLFVLLQQLRQFLLPLLVLLLFGAGNRNEWWGLIAVAVLVLMAVWQYHTYRYRIGRDSLQIRSGLLERTLREIPFSRIHNVSLRQSALHRVFGVAEVRLESAGGQRPEAEMRVLAIADAHALESLVRGEVGQQADAGIAREGMPGTVAATTPSTTLLTLPFPEVVRLGLLSRRGMIVVGAALAALSQIDADVLAAPIERVVRRSWAWLDLHPLSTGGYALATALTLLLALIALQGLSVALALLQYSHFRLSRNGERLTIERGLLGRTRSSASLQRIQAWMLHEGIMHRLFHRRRLTVANAAAAGDHEQRAFGELAPVATPTQSDALIRQLLPQAHWPVTHWQALHRHARWPMAVPGVTLALMLTVLTCWQWGPPGLVAASMGVWAILVADRRARASGWQLQDQVLCVRDGWCARRWHLAELDKLQVISLHRSPLQQRLGMATLALETAGTGSDTALLLKHLPLSNAQALQAQLLQRIAGQPLNW